MIYFFQGRLTRRVKIGVTTRGRLLGRLKEVQSYCADDLDVLGVYDEDKYTERQLHEIFAHLRTHGEWFRMSSELQDFIDDLKPLHEGELKTLLLPKNNWKWSHKTCIICLQPFAPETQKQKFCSAKCRRAHWENQNPRFKRNPF